MNGRAARLASAVACAACAACSLFVDTGEFSGENGVAPNDGGASNDGASAGDAGAAEETGVDGGSDANVAAACPVGGFCDDFERMDPQGLWDHLNKGGGCTLSIDPTTFARGAASLKNVLLAETQESVCYAYVSKDFAFAPSKVSLGFSIRISASVLRDIHIAGIGVSDPERALFLNLAKVGPYVVEQQFGTGSDAGSEGYQAGSLSPGVWHRVVLEHEIATKHTVLSIDGETRVDRILTRSFAAADFGVSIGSNYQTAGDAIDIWYDDVRVVPTP